MDPNEAYRLIKAYMSNIRQYHENEFVPDGQDIENLLENWEALDNWLKSGGFLPDAWKADRRDNV